MSDERPIFVIDGMNMFLRSYSAFPQMSSHGYQMGGTVGFLKSLQRLCREFQPTSVYVTWEGGGSQRRRKLYPDYKANRKPGKLNRFYGEDIPDTEENKQHQLVTLLGALKNVPVCQVYVSDCEGDDIVAFLVRGPFRDKNVVIVSADKDMYQLLSPEVKIYSLYRKKFITDEDLFEEFRIRAHNFALAKCLCGDDSDNIPGVQGFGFKSVAKKFPMLGSDDTIILQDIINYAHTQKGVLYKRLVEEVSVVNRNWQLVHLDGSMLSGDQMKRVEHVVDTFKPVVNKMGLIKLLLKEGISDFDYEGFYYDLSCVDGLRFASEIK
jgi:DNA polymerase-1